MTLSSRTRRTYDLTAKGFEPKAIRFWSLYLSNASTRLATVGRQSLYYLPPSCKVGKVPDLQSTWTCASKVLALISSQTGFSVELHSRAYWKGRAGGNVRPYNAAERANSYIRSYMKCSYSLQ